MTLAERSCGNCMLCCKLPSIRELEKPAYKWCQYAKSGLGCVAYDTRPSECRAFNCVWLNDLVLGPEWHPARSRFYLVQKDNGNLIVMVDPSSPTSWRQPKYYETLRAKGSSLLEQGAYLLVVIGKNVVFLLPHKEIATTMPPDGFALTLKSIQNGAKIDFEVMVVPQI